MTENTNGKGDRRGWKRSTDREVKILASDDLSKYTLADVILPMPGYDVVYPEGPLFEKYKEIMAADGLDPSKMRRNQKYVCRVSSYSSDANGLSAENSLWKDRTARSCTFPPNSAGDI